MKIRTKQNPYIPPDLILEAESIELNWAQVTYKGKDVFLTPDEFTEIVDENDEGKEEHGNSVR